MLLLAGCDASTPVARSDYPEKDGKAFQVYAYNCSQCHAPPLPDAHPASEWPGVIARMDRYRIQKAYGAINAADKVTILQYLSRYSAKEQQQ